MANIASDEGWSGRVAFIMATVGSAIGLGNIWQFPFLTGQNGGAVFVIVYLGALALVGFPILVAEVMLGRLGQASPPVGLANVAGRAGTSRHWSKVGYICLIILVLVLGLYSVIAGWTLAYAVKMSMGDFAGQDGASVVGIFRQFQGEALGLIGWQSLFLGLTVLVVIQGVRGGIEKLVNIGLPLLGLILVGLVLYGAVEGAFSRATTYLFSPDWSQLTPGIAIAAVGQAFFSLGVGSGGVMMYGAYLGKEINIIRACGWVALADTAVAILAGLAIFPLVFANGLDPAEGPGLVFVSLPIAFGALPGGIIFGTLFFILLMIAAVTSTVSMATPIVGWLMDKGLTRRAAGVITGVMCWLVGLLTVFSFNHLADFAPLGFIPAFQGQTFFALSLTIINQIGLPICGLLFALLAAWLLPKAIQTKELGGGISTHLWRLSARFAAPIGVVALLIYGWFG